MKPFRTCSEKSFDSIRLGTTRLDSELYFVSNFIGVERLDVIVLIRTLQRGKDLTLTLTLAQNLSGICGGGWTVKMKKPDSYRICASC
jgi:hypothetical protein